jgi:hypothetical protein
MLPIKGALRGRRGLKWLGGTGSYTVITNKKLHEKGKASKFAVANPRHGVVTTVHGSPDEALDIARTLGDNAIAS